MYKFRTNKSFDKSLEKLLKKNPELRNKAEKSFKALSSNPFYPGLKTHLVNLSKYGKVYSSWVTADIRILWNFDENDNLVLLLIDIGGHSGSKGVY
jgi:mRNA-degrading endonuclease YafQ of YafQ-DinJ toxin-antitoxin module